MLKISKLVATLAILVSALFASTQAFAVYTITVNQVGADVVASGSGTVNTTGLTSLGSGGGGSLVLPSGADLLVGGNNMDTVYRGATGPTNIGTGSGLLSATSNSGLLVGIFSGDLFIPSGSLGTSTATWTGQTFATLGLSSGTYTWTWGSGGNADSFVINVVAPAPLAPASVPTLSEYGLMLLGSLIAMFGIWQVRKRNEQ